VACADHAFTGEMYRITATLRSKGHAANFSYKLGGLSKQLKEAAGQNAARCIIIGQEYSDNRQLVVKDMAAGEQELVDADAFLAGLDVS